MTTPKTKTFRTMRLAVACATPLAFAIACFPESAELEGSCEILLRTHEVPALQQHFAEELARAQVVGVLLEQVLQVNLGGPQLARRDGRARLRKQLVRRCTHARRQPSAKGQ